ncbi:MAG: glycosyltransferase family 4 protein [Elusimicrobia bacterium]|nr:glycosyltransferase family 4 protein [Elusimicrobiota bacterium]
MRKILFIGSHLGYPMERTPLGGGAMVGLQLLRHWRGSGRDIELAALGSGPCPPEGLSYAQLGRSEGLVSLSELEYAAFCARFEEETTRWVLDRQALFPPSRTCLIVNDISESPDLEALSRAGYPIVSIWHVDVIDYFNRIYLRRWLSPDRLSGLYESWRRLMGAALPRVLKLVFEKQRRSVLFSRKVIVPSSGMASTLRRCYRGLDLRGKAKVVPWGCWGAPAPVSPAAVEELKRHYQIGESTRVLMTMSRISPEKGLHILLRALGDLEADTLWRGRDLCVLVCGEAAFMQGRSYFKKVRRASARLRRPRVFFPGYLDDERKKPFFAAADLFVSPSIHESYGLNIAEALQASVPVLAMDHYGVRELLRPEYGRVVGDASELGEAIREMLEEPDRLKDMGRRAHDAASAMRFEKSAREVLDEALELVA